MTIQSLRGECNYQDFHKAGAVPKSSKGKCKQESLQGGEDYEDLVKVKIILRHCIFPISLRSKYVCQISQGGGAFQDLIESGNSDLSFMWRV